MPSTQPFVHLILDEEVIEKIDDFRYAKRIPSRNAAIRRLIMTGLDLVASGKLNMDQYPRELGQLKKSRKRSVE